MVAANGGFGKKVMEGGDLNERERKGVFYFNCFFIVGNKKMKN